MKQKLLVMLLAVPLVASAANHRGTWQVCHLQIQAVKHLTAFPGGSLQARVLNVQADPWVSDCPARGATITFSPETSDYQNMLPYKRWPKVGQKIKMRYQYLDGICKGDGRPDYPCRIKHYPVP
jgi:hypothetical protein